jgi:thioredoxin reductase (NADPH)
MVIPAEAVGLDCSQMPYGIQLADGRRVKGSTVVVASGARYRRPDIPRLREFEGRGVWYWASPIEARLCRNEEVALVGGGNSAGQAAVFLRDFAAKVWMLVRGPSLAESMSQYLIDRIAAADNIEVLTETEITVLSGSPEGQLECVRWRNRVTGAEREKPIRNAFIFIGADPATGWLKGCGVGLDAKGFVRTGAALPATGMMKKSGPRRPFPLEAEIANVFAVGDVRAGSVKRVGAAIGEGAAAVAQIHTVLSNASVPPPATRERRARG